MLRDPKTDAIPPAIRTRELAFARTLPTRDDRPAKSAAMPLFDWEEAGPTDVGGRTRALAIDADDRNTILAAGASGGIWKSTDRGNTWSLRSDGDDLLHITALAQDPRAGSRHIWYAGGGEFRTSSSDNGGRAFIYGTGILKSTDNGDTWDFIAVDAGTDPTSFDSEFDYVHRIVVSPTTGAVFIAVNGFGIWRSTDQGASFSPLIGPFGLLPIWSDVAVSSDGEILAVLSSGFVEQPTEEPGIYHSTNNGTTWTNITPDGFPEEHERSVVAIAPSNPDVAYVMTFTGTSTPTGEAFEDEDIAFWKLDLSTGVGEDRTANLPDFGTPVGLLNSQFSYNLDVAVKPDDEDFVLIGGINLFRSRDGFATPATTPVENWIGGYDIANNVSFYPNQHPDQHVIVFDETTPTTVWVGHDGGISTTDEIAASGRRLGWSRRVDGYNVTQYYHVALAPGSDDTRLLGGTQDNGSPFFRYDPVTDDAEVSDDLSSGDGAYAFMGIETVLVSSQMGRLLRYQFGFDGEPFFVDELTPPDAADQLFINPLAVDAIDESVIYYPAGQSLWRFGEEAASSDDWERLNALTVPAGYEISALAAGTRDVPGQGIRSVLYFAASSLDAAPLLYRLDNASSTTGAAVALALSAESGAYVHDLALNAADGDELLIVVSNYNTESLYHTSDAGTTFSAVEGNLSGTVQTPGPSVRSAEILPTGNGRVFLVGTSAGVYATEAFSGEATEWVREADEALGLAIVQSIASRPSDGRIALGTHGRGIFVGLPRFSVPIEEEEAGTRPTAFALQPNFPNPFRGRTEIVFSLPSESRVQLAVYDAAGRTVAVLVNGDVLAAGRHRLVFDASSLASGSYIYALTATPRSGTTDHPFVASQTMTLVR
jgi:photosystem II stability/assembly factor-like uncharacterized protein